MSPPHPKVFFILPMTRYHPDHYIRLGQVIKDPMKPWDRLSPPIPLNGLLEPQISEDYEWHARNTDSDFYSVGAFAHVLDTLTAEASRSGSGQETTTWEAAKLETQYFEPSFDAESRFADKLVAIPAVKKYLSKVRFIGGSAYVITGLKIARNPGQFSTSSARKSEIKAKLEAAVDPQGTEAVKVGAEGSEGGESNASESKTPGHDYVFAYRLSKIYVSWLTGKAKLKERQGGDLAGEHVDVDDEMGSDLGGSEPGGDEYDSGTEDTDWEIKDASIQAEDVGTDLPADGFDLREVEGVEGDKYTLIRTDLF